jgi:hypothetical protein
LRYCDSEVFRNTWVQIHSMAACDLAQTIGRVCFEQISPLLVEMEAPVTLLHWQQDPASAAYRLSATFTPVRDHTPTLAPLPAKRLRTAAIRFVTACDCESRTLEWPTPLPPSIVRSLPDGTVRAFEAHGENPFGTILYREVSRRKPPTEIQHDA